MIVASVQAAEKQLFSNRAAWLLFYAASESLDIFAICQVFGLDWMRWACPWLAQFLDDGISLEICGTSYTCHAAGSPQTVYHVASVWKTSTMARNS